MKESIPPEIIEKKIFLVRRQRVMLSSHLAELYEVEVRTLVQAVKRNIERFPEDFAFQLTDKEYKNLKSQIVILKNDSISENKTASMRGKHIKYLPYAFTEQGVAMLSSVLNSKRAIQVNIAIMRAIVRSPHFSGKEFSLLKQGLQMEVTP